MNGAGDNSSKPEFTDSDSAWFDALTGQPKPGAKAPAAREGRALRAALEQRQHEIAASPELAAATSDDAMQHQLQRLRQRAKAEGVFEAAPGASPSPSNDAAPTASSTPAQPKSNVIEFPWWRRRKALVGLAASLVVALVVVQQTGDRADYPPPNEMLGADGLQRLRAPRPRQAAEQLAERLVQAGLRPGLYQRGKTYLVDITLLASDLKVAEPGFATLGIKPVVGFNRVEIAAP
jgi:hypothetical protein